jgi:hypothetical protein
MSIASRTAARGSSLLITLAQNAEVSTDVPCRAYLAAFQHLVGTAAGSTDTGGRHLAERRRPEKVAA